MQILPLFAYTTQTEFSCIGTKVYLEFPPSPPARVLSVELKVSIHIIGLFDDN